MDTIKKCNENPIITIVMPVYNGESYLTEMLEHIVQAGHQNIELLLIDDGSSDRSGKICQQYEKLDRRIRYVRQNNHGIAASRNRGIELAHGAYICFWDQDDLAVLEVYYKLLHKMEIEHAQIGVCGTKRIIQGKSSAYENIQDRVYLNDEVKEELLYPLLFRGYRYPFAESVNYLYGTVWKFIFKIDFIRDNQILFKRFINYEDDWIFVTSALCCADKVAAVSDVGYFWRVNNESESHKDVYIEDLCEKFDAFDEYVLNYLACGIDDKVVLEKYKSINLCENYMDICRNAVNMKSVDEKAIGNKKAYREYVWKYLQKTDYKKQLACRKFLKSSAYRKRVMLNALWYGGISVACFACRIYDKVEAKIGKIQWIILMERGRKIK